MNILRVTLLGRFEVTWNGQPVSGFEHAKARELFSYLLLNRNRPNSREVVANHLWGGHYTTDVSKKYLRKALWQLNEALSGCSEEIREQLILADANWLQINNLDSLWVDAAVIDDAYAAVKGIPGAMLAPEAACELTEAVSLYNGELLEGAYQEWSFPDVIRFRQVVLILLDKLMDHAMARGDFESVLKHGERVLRHDPARELTHLKLMRALHATGDRTGAIRQFNRCRDMLREELDIEPSSEVLDLYDQIRYGNLTQTPAVTLENTGKTVRGSLSNHTNGAQPISQWRLSATH